MLIRWLQQILFGAPTAHPASIKQGGDAAEGIDGKLLDVVREAMREEATDLGHLVQHGFPAVQRRRTRQRVRKKVRRAIHPMFNAPEVLDEVTERLANAVEVDPYYARLFAEEETK